MRNVVSSKVEDYLYNVEFSMQRSCPYLFSLLHRDFGFPSATFLRGQETLLSLNRRVLDINQTKMWNTCAQLCTPRLHTWGLIFLSAEFYPNMSLVWVPPKHTHAHTQKACVLWWKSAARVMFRSAAWEKREQPQGAQTVRLTILTSLLKSNIIIHRGEHFTSIPVQTMIFQN